MIIPIVTLDKIYLKPDDKNVFFLDCTRVNGSNQLITRRGEDIDLEIRKLVSKIKCKNVILADDVIFSGSVLKTIIDKLNKNGINVVKIISSISTIDGYDNLSKITKYGVDTCYLMNDEVIDQICERDFYFGIAGSGIMEKDENGYYKKPYFIPFGNPNERASIPKEKELVFSDGCLERSIEMLKELESNSGKEILMCDLPEKIYNTEPQERVVKRLVKERKESWKNYK